MSQEKRDWRELCRAIVNEQDSDRLAELAKRLLTALDEHAAGMREGVAHSKPARLSGNPPGPQEERN
jgi:hypothetical protein